MTGPTMVVLALFILVIGGARNFVARPDPGEKPSALSRGDLIGSKILIIGGLALVVAGAVVTVVELLN